MRVVMFDLALRLKCFLIGLDQACNGLVNKSPDETLSAAAFRLSKASKRWSIFKTIVDHLFFFDNEERNGVKIKHCELSYESELNKRYSPKEYK